MNHPRCSREFFDKLEKFDIDNHIISYMQGNMHIKLSVTKFVSNAILETLDLKWMYNNTEICYQNS